MGDERHLDVVVDAVESLGSDTYAYFAMPGAESQCIARLDATARLHQGETARLHYDVRNIHVFDRASGLRLS